MEILKQGLDEAYPTRLANLFLNFVLSADHESSTAFGLSARESAGHVLLYLALEVEAEFFTHLRFHLLAAK